MKPLRPVLRWHGGKWLLAPWVTSHFPPHRHYTEAFGGAASVLLRKPRSYAEVYNDLDGEVVNLFRVLQNSKSSARLKELLALTPFARAEFERSYKVTKDPVEQARRLVIRSFMGFGSNGHNKRVRTGFRANSNRSATTPAHDWANYPDKLEAIVRRLRGVVIENKPAIEVLMQHDSNDTLHYVDPPYVHSTRTDDTPDYNFEMTDDEHRELADVLKTLKGAVVLSGYRSELYANLYSDWRSVERRALADGARARVEVLWMNRKAAISNKDLFV